jgi:hypothetical protein
MSRSRPSLIINVTASPQTTLTQNNKTAMLAELESGSVPSTARLVELAEVIQRESLSEGVKGDMTIYIGNVEDPHFTGEKSRRELANTLYGMLMKQEPVSLSELQKGGGKKKQQKQKSRKTRKNTRRNRRV